MSDVLLSMVSSGRTAQQSGKSDTGVSASAGRSVNGFNQALESAQRQASQPRPDTPATRKDERADGQQGNNAEPAATSSDAVKSAGDAQAPKAGASASGGKDLPEDTQSAAATGAAEAATEDSPTEVTNEVDPRATESAVETAAEGEAAADAAEADALSAATVTEALQPGQVIDKHTQSHAETPVGKPGETPDEASESTSASQAASTKASGEVAANAAGMNQAGQSVSSATQTDASQQTAKAIQPAVNSDPNPNGKAAVQSSSTVSADATAEVGEGESSPKQSMAGVQQRQVSSEPSTSQVTGNAQSAASANPVAAAQKAPASGAAETSARGGSADTTHSTSGADVLSPAGKTTTPGTKGLEGAESANKAQSARVSTDAAPAPAGAPPVSKDTQPVPGTVAKTPAPADLAAHASAAVVAQSGNKAAREPAKPIGGATHAADATAMTAAHGTTPAGQTTDKAGAVASVDSATERLSRPAEQAIGQGREAEAARIAASAKGGASASSVEVKVPTAEPVITGQASEPATAERPAPLSVSLSPVAQALARMHQLTESKGSADAVAGDAMDTGDVAEIPAQSSNSGGKPSLLEQLALLRGLRLPPARDSHVLQGTESNPSTLQDAARLGAASPVDAALLSNAGKPSTPAQPLVTTLQASVFQAQWAPELGQKLAMMISQQINEAEIRLDPPELGPMRVNIKMQNEQASVTFTSHSAVVRETLEQAMPRLRDMLEQQGLGLGDANVRDQSSRQGQGQQEPGEGLAGLSGEAGDDVLADPESHVTQRATPSRLVDYYA